MTAAPGSARRQWKGLQMKNQVTQVWTYAAPLLNGKAHLTGVCVAGVGAVKKHEDTYVNPSAQGGHKGGTPSSPLSL